LARLRAGQGFLYPTGGQPLSPHSRISFEEDRIETVKIIDLGLAKGCEDLLGNFDEWD
jgi:hypothetical protein